MEREKFIKTSWKAFMEVTYQNNRMPNPISVLVLAVDFDNDTIKIQILDHEAYEDLEFWASIDYIELPKRTFKLKIT